jgi:transcriptional regulator with XRE-family HTH domain
MDRARYQQEAQRLAALLRGEIQRQGVSIRSLEQKMGVGNSVYQKVLGGKISMTLGHLLQMADALGLDWSDLFRMAYPGPSQTPEAPAAEGDDFDQRVMDVLRRHGLLPDSAARG